MNIDHFKETEDAITLHGLGFLQVKLQGKQRLHVWHPELPRRACFQHSAIHNHRFGFTSLVLVGTQINHNVGVRDDDGLGNEVPEGLHIAYLHEGERTQFGNRPWIKDKLVIVTPTFVETVGPGETYRMAMYDFHWTEPGGDGKVATIMKKTEEGTRGAHSLCRFDVQPDVDFDRKQWSQDHLWEVVRDVLGDA